VPIGKARLNSVRFLAARAGYSCSVALLALLFGGKALQNAEAEGDTRTITMHHVHTDEDITITFKRNGVYDQAALDKLNWFLRDWRKSEKIDMDPHLIDLVWEVQRENGSNQPIWVVCGYRSPETNAMLRHRSAGVARFSQHMLGHAMDFYIPGANLEHLREIGLRLARGGVGFYPTSGSPFVHMDTGNVRMWPRMSHDELVRVFPDGKTVQIPSDGKPLPGYAVALAEIQSRGNNPSDNSLASARGSGVDTGTQVASNSGFKNPFAKLLGLRTNSDDDDGDSVDAPSTTASVVAAAKGKVAAVIQNTAQKTAAVAEKTVAAVADKAKATAQTTAAATAQLAKNAETKLVQTASLMQMGRTSAAASPSAAPSNANAGRIGAPSANQVISSRGFWQTTPDNVAPPSPAQVALRNALNARSQSANMQVASADPGADRVPTDLALGYAEQPGRGSPSAAIAAATAAATGGLTPQNVMSQNGITTEAKDSPDQPRSSFQRAIQLATAAVKVRQPVNSPWLRAIVMSPSVHRFLSTLSFGARDLTSLEAMMVKPSSAVMMKFSNDPSMGLPHDHFARGNAIVFLQTVTYQTRTASLQ
jgi:uncharacterized protein YcbK (DUF882 family)